MSLRKKIMRGIQFLFLLVILVLTAANPTADDAGPTEKIPVKEILQMQNKCECLRFPRPVDCEEVRLNGYTASGVYIIWPRSRKAACKSIEVYCDMTVDGGGWTVLQRRGKYGNAENYFHKTWESYKNGFGQLEKEFWLGNEIIYGLTNQGSYSVRFDMRHVNGTSAFAVYDQFWIEDEERKYQLNIGEYSGNAGDSMSYHHRMKFSTRDSDNDACKDHCSQIDTGGWWFNQCTRANLNGMNWQGAYTEKGPWNGIIWQMFTGWWNSLEISEIKIRPRHFI